MLVCVMRGDRGGALAAASVGSNSLREHYV